MPLNQPGNNAYVSIRGTVNDVAGDQHNITNYYNHPSNSYARGKRACSDFDRP